MEEVLSKQPVERRSHARFGKSFELEGSSGEGVARMIASDLSLGGLYCTSTTDFPEMARLSVRLSLPGLPGTDDGKQPMELEAVVVRRKKLNSRTGNSKYELALFFTSITDIQRMKIARYLALS